MNHELAVMLGLGVAIYGLAMFITERVFKHEETTQDEQDEQDVQLEVSPPRTAVAYTLIVFRSILSKPSLLLPPLASFL